MAGKDVVQQKRAERASDDERKRMEEDGARKCKVGMWVSRNEGEDEETLRSAVEGWQAGVEHSSAQSAQTCG
eukprot:73910-Rhodomonas_salina.1